MPVAAGADVSAGCSPELHARSRDKRSVRTKRPADNKSRGWGDKYKAALLRLSLKDGSFPMKPTPISQNCSIVEPGWDQGNRVLAEEYLEEVIIPSAGL